MVDVLIRGGANVNAPGPANQSSLFFAALKSHLNVMKVLVNSDVNLNCQDKLGKINYQHVVKLLICLNRLFIFFAHDFVGSACSFGFFIPV